MGKVVKTVLKVAAGVAIAAFAPQLAAPLLKTVGVSGALASTVASAAIGAGLGQATGLGWKSGLAIGGFAGAGQSGLFGGTSKGAVASGGAGGTAAPVAGEAASVANLPGAGGSLAEGVTAGIQSPVQNLPSIAPSGGGIGGALGSAASTAGNALKTGLSNVQAGVGGALNQVGMGGTVGGLNLGAVAPTLLAAGLVSTPGAGIVKAQQAELERAQAMNAALTQQRIDEANKLIGEAAYYDPEYMGRQAAEAAMIRGGIQETEGTRGLTGERLAAERRRFKLGTSRTAGSAYQQGYGVGAESRMKTRAAGISALPTQFPTTTAESANALTNMATADAMRSAQAKSLSKLFGQAMGRPVESEEDQNKSFKLVFG